VRRYNGSRCVRSITELALLADDKKEEMKRLEAELERQYIGRKGQQ
jgi:hypothetical protein